MEDAANDGLRWRLQKVNVVLQNEARKDPPHPPPPHEETKRERWSLEAGCEEAKDSSLQTFSSPLLFKVQRLLLSHHSAS